MNMARHTASVTQEHIEALARQARIELDAGEVEAGRQYLEGILDLLATLGEVDVSAVPPYVVAEALALLHDPPGPTPLREDLPGAGLPRP